MKQLREYLGLAFFSLAFLFIYTAFNGTLMFEKSILDATVHKYIRINMFYLFIIIYMGLFLAAFNAPMVVRYISIKASLAVGVGTIAAFIVTALVPSTWLLYLMAVLPGLGLALMLVSIYYFNYLNAGSTENFILHTRIFTFVSQFSFLVASIVVFAAMKNENEINYDVRLIVLVTFSVCAVVGIVIAVFLKVPDWTGEAKEFNANTVIRRAFQLLYGVWIMVHFNFVAHFLLGYIRAYFVAVWFLTVGGFKKLTEAKLLMTEAGMIFGLGAIAANGLFGLFGKYTSDKVGRYLIAWLLILLIVPLGVLLNYLINPPELNIGPHGVTIKAIEWGPNFMIVAIYSIVFGLIEGTVATLLQITLIVAFGDIVSDYIPVYLVSLMYQTAGAALCFLLSALAPKVNGIMIPLFSGLGLLFYGIFDLALVMKKKKEEELQRNQQETTP